MQKKISISFLIIALLVVAGGGFYWKQNQAEVKEINKTLPEGVKITKSLFGNEYKVINSIDGYEFKVPKAWEGIEEVEYIPKLADEKYNIASINVKGLNGPARLVAVDRIDTNEDVIEIEGWARKIFDEYGFTGEFMSDKVGNIIDVVKTQEDVHLGGMYVYFFRKNQSIYVITNGSEEFIQEIILNGKW